jgi:nitroreductase
MDLFDAIRKRFSYRGTYEAAPVPRTDLKKIVEAGLMAPSGCNMQTTHAVAVDDPALLKKMGDLLKKPNFTSAPAAILVLTHEVPGNGGKLYHVQDYAAAIENMLLAIAALGYASCWVEGYVRYYDDIALRMARLIGAPAEYAVVAYLPVGVAAESGSRVEKIPFSKRCGFNKFVGE